MASCLGLYIEDNIIKYAKISKDHDQIKVESFGIQFYEKLEDAIDKVIEETYSQKTPISINLSEETYNYFGIFSLLKKTDMKKAIKTEFDSYCEENGYNPNVFETRYALAEDMKVKDKLKVIFVSDNKIELNRKLQQMHGYKIASISPVPITLPNLIGDNLEGRKNAIIVNIEGKTTITTIINNKVQNIDILEEGSIDFLSKLNLRENSYAKAYELCKNTTIYTSEGKELQAEETSVLEDIMPTLYSILSKVKKIITDIEEKFEKVYITGTGAMINNIDLYFQEYINEAKCEILRPYFIKSTKDLSVKDYQEVNTAISLSLMGINQGITEMNFKRKSLSDRIPDWLKLEINPDINPKKKEKTGEGKLAGFFINDLGQKFDKTETALLRVVIALILIVTIYSLFSGLLNTQMVNKKTEADKIAKETSDQINLANEDNNKVKSRTSEYTKMISRLEAINSKVVDKSKTRNAVPDLLNQLMYIIPSNVQITSIENTTGTHMVINAQSDKYEQLGYFKAKIKSDVILTNVISTAGEKTSNIVTVKIEGELP